MNTHTALLAAAVLVTLPIAAFLMFGWPETLSAPEGGVDAGAVACTMEAKQCPDGSYVGRTGPHCEFALCPGESAQKGGAVGVVTSDTFPSAGPDITWRFSEAGEFDGLPYTRVFVTIDGRERALGEYVGSCSDTGTQTDLSGHVASVLCWYAGGGSELAVFADKQRGGYVVKVRDVDEGSAEVPGTRGQFKEVMRIEE